MKNKSFLTLIIMIAMALAPLPGVQAATINDVQDGDWSTSATWDSGEPAGDDTVYIDDHAVTITQAGEGSQVVYVMDNGSLTISSGDLALIYSSSFLLESSAVVQNGGSVSAWLTSLNDSATYNLSNGILNTEELEIADNSVFSHAGGTLNGTGSYKIYIQDGSDGGGSYLMEGGTIAGTWDSLYVARASNFSGYGTITASGNTIDNSGRIEASSGTLDFSGWGAVVNTVDNTGTKGWYATDQGKLILPKVHVATGTHTYNWGEASGDTTIDLVNSMRLAFSGVTSGGDFTISLLALDSPEFPDTASWAKVAGGWNIEAPVGFTGTAALAFRYDAALAASLGITESELKIYHYNGSAWVNVTSSVDTVNNIIYTRGVTSFSPFGVGTDFNTPEPATVVSGLIGLLGLAAKRLARRKRGKFLHLFNQN